MNVRNLFTDDDAVSPVIGVILMVAITVILAAVIGAFVLNIGGSQDTAPQATFDFETNSTNTGTDLTHQGGDTIDTSNLKITHGDSANSPFSSFGSGFTAGSDEQWSGGETVTVSGQGEVQVIWGSPSSDKTSIIGSQEV